MWNKNLLLLILLPDCALAAEPARAPLVVCLSAEEAASRITYCSQNGEVVNKAIDCYEELDRTWKTTAGELSKSLLGVQKRSSTRQQGEMNFSKNDYATSVDKMSHLIATTEFDLARIHEYSKTMLDLIGAESDEESSSCYLENVARLRLVEDDFRKMIDEAKSARAKAESLGGTSGAREVAVASDNVNKMLREPGRLPASAAPIVAVKARSPRRVSDITGTERSRVKEILSAYKVRDQLTAP
jgi:hypothetical protein